MAKTLKWPSSLAKKTEKIEGQRCKESLFIFFSGLVIFGVAYLLDICKLSWAHWIGTVGLIIIIAGLVSLLSPSNAEKIFTRGNKGEIAVAQILNTLPEEWIVINDIIVQGAQIDHIAIGPTGIFCIETKNWSTAGTDQQDNWYIYKYGQWHPIQENPARQNMGHVKALKGTLGKECPYINSLIVLAAFPDGRFYIVKRTIQPGNAFICTLNELYECLTKWPGKELSKKAVSSIADAIMNEAAGNIVQS